MNSRTAITFLLVAVCAAWGSGPAPLNLAIRGGDVNQVRILLRQGADPNARDDEGHRPLIDAVEHGQIQTLRLLIDAGADPNLGDRGLGSPLEVAEREGHTEQAAMLRQAGARTSGRSVGNKVCVRPWKGDGYCGLVEAVSGTAYRIRITNLVGCREGCSARPDCSAGRPVGGDDGLKLGDALTTSPACLTHTDVAP